LLRAARDDERDGSRFCALSNSLYQRKVDRAYYRWQFFGPPHPSVLALAETDAGVLAGCEGVQVRESSMVGVRTAWLIDIMVVPSFQRKGVFRSLTEFALRELAPLKPAALCVMANAQAAAAVVQGMGWRRVTTFRTFSCATGPFHPRGHLRVKPLHDFADCADVLSGGGAERRMGPPGLVANRRDARYLLWRFEQNPRYRYTAFVAHRADAVFGYLVLKKFEDPATGTVYGDVVDVMWIDDDPDALAELLRFALGHFHSQGVSRAAAWLQTNTALDAAGLEAGFTSTGHERYFCVRVLDERQAILVDPARWYLTMADAEVY
jgi:GNAT superfamily N-acetyltransferase